MKKTIFFALMVGGLAASFFVGVSVSQERQLQLEFQQSLVNQKQLQLKQFEANRQIHRPDLTLIDDTADAKSQVQPYQLSPT